ncbi:MAG TPA: diaminopimelate epimerase [Streptosporangiaceae bacterium]|nr:diaminopimelate epimerase [Streptosporangiaceae bacterium]
MRFAKGHGTENDFVILPDPDGAVDLTGTLAARLCDRRAGVGGDGVLRATRVASSLAGANGGAEWFMDYRNADGSLAEMCGNGIRVFARYLIEHGLTASDEFGVATRAGTRQVRAEPDGAITVDMGLPRVLGPGRALLAGQPFDGLAVSLGNPHLACVASDPLDSFDLSRPPVLDPGQFPEGANFELVRIAGAGHIEMRVYERGCGPTRSCGTGAVAAAVAAAAATAPAATVTAPAGAPVPAGTWTVDLPGGRLRVILGRETSFLSGPAVIVAEGELDERWLSERPGFPPQSSPDA